MVNCCGRAAYGACCVESVCLLVGWLGVHSLTTFVAQVGWLLRNKMKSMWKEAATALFEVLYRRMAGGTGQNHEYRVCKAGLVV